MIGSEEPRNLSLNFGRPQVLDTVVLKDVAVGFQLRTLSEVTLNHNPIEMIFRDSVPPSTMRRKPTGEALRKRSPKRYKRSIPSTDQRSSSEDAGNKNSR